MAIVTDEPSRIVGELTVTWEHGTLETTVQGPIPSGLDEVGTLLWLDAVTAALLDLPLEVVAGFETLGAFQSLSWTVTAVPAVIPLPPSLWLLAGAVALLGAVRFRPGA